MSKMPGDFAILFRKEVNEYDFGEGHPLHQRRGEDFLVFLKKYLKVNFPIIKAKKATLKDLLLICEREYIEFTQKYFEAKNRGEDFNGNFFKYHSSDNFPLKNPGKIEKAARYILGQAKLGADLVMNGKFKKVISIGGGLHHAKRNFGEGFCLYNDVAFCAKYLLQKYHLKRILILDTDAHAGNGTMEYFYQEARVLFIDLHQDPKTLYPGSGFIYQIGEGEGKGFTINIPLPPGASDKSFELVFEEIIEPLAFEFLPEIIIRNGGSDPHFADKLTSLGLTLEGFKMVGRKVRNLCQKLTQGKEIDFIGSGYNLKVLYHAWTALISGLVGAKIEIEEPLEVPFHLKSDPALKETKKIVKNLKKVLKAYWKSLKT